MAPVAAGRWEGLVQSTVRAADGPGDTRIEHHAWQLSQRGHTITGFYVVELTMISGDGRAYVCSQTPRFSTLLRFELRGEVGASGVELQEVGEAKAKGPCRPTFRTPEHYQAKVQGDVLTLVGAGRKQTLYRRPRSATAETDDLASIAFDGPANAEAGPAPALVAPPPSALPPTDLHGYWVWETRATLPTGDEKQEREEWHLTQDGHSVTGYYDRAVRQASTDGLAYRCNGATDFRVLTRYQLSGEIQGDHLVLSEQSFEILERSPCDDGQRRLDSYQGLATPSELRLMWGVGQQVLHRARPDVPTQRF